MTATLPDVPRRHRPSPAPRRRAAFAPDLVIGIGGGSCLDMAKCAALLLAHGGRPQDYYGEFKVPGPVLPLIAVPTTAGTGSEVTPVAVISDPDRTLKVGISSPYLIPTVAICDPDLTLTCPRRADRHRRRRRADPCDRGLHRGAPRRRRRSWRRSMSSSARTRCPTISRWWR